MNAVPEKYQGLRSFAFGDGLEGEGDRSLDYWRQAHRSHFGRQGKFREDMMLMCERFRLVEIF